MAQIKSVTFQVDGVKELDAVFNEIVNDFNEKDSKKILVKSVRLAMNPVLSAATMRAPVDTGALRASLRIEARKPNSKDRRSAYYNPNQVVISLVTTAPGNVLAKKSFYNYSESYKQKKNVKTKGIPSDARANVQEFGSYKMPAHPYMRTSLESQSQTVTDNLGKNLALALDQYKSKGK
jgi:HK97 gp10 family phage protein